MCWCNDAIPWHECDQPKCVAFPGNPPFHVSPLMSEQDRAFLLHCQQDSFADGELRKASRDVLLEEVARIRMKYATETKVTPAQEAFCKSLDADEKWRKSVSRGDA